MLQQRLGPQRLDELLDIGDRAEAVLEGEDLAVDALTGRLPLPAEQVCLQYARRFDWPVIAARVRDVYGEVA